MRNLLILLLFALSTPALAQTAWFPIGKPGANTNYWDKADCEAKENANCYDIGKCPLDECSLVAGVMVRDAAKTAAKAAAAADQAAKAAAKKKGLDDFRNADISKVNNIAELKSILQALQEHLKE